MTQDDPHIKSYHALGPGHYNVLTKLEVRQPPEEFPEVTLELTLRSSDLTDNRALVLTFFKVWDLRYVPGEYPPFYQTPLSIFAVREPGEETGSYRVFDSESGNDFSFLCVSFTAMVQTSGE